MKSKIKNQTPSTSILNDSNHYSSYLSKDLSFNEAKKETMPKGYSRNCNKKQKSRQFNSLDELTKKFIKYVHDTGSDLINLNTVMKKIKAKKRRIYDITNVLEGLSNKYIIFNYIGIGLITKASKNQIKLKKEFFDLYNQNSQIILLNEEENNIKINNKNSNQKEKNNEKKINYYNIIKKYINEIKYVDKLIDYTNKQLLIFNPNINNNFEILEQTVKIINKNNDVNYRVDKNNDNCFINKTIDNISKNGENLTKTNPLNTAPEMVFHLLENGNNSNVNNIKSKDCYDQEKKEEDNCEDDFWDLFNENNANKNDINFELNENKRRKESFILDFLDEGNFINLPGENHSF
jgi:hypothetical protein